MPKKSELIPRYVGPLEAARLMGVSRSRVYELLKAGELSSRYDGKRRLIPVVDIDKWYFRLPLAPTPTQAPSGALLPRAQQEAAIARATEPEPDWAAVYTERLRALRGLGDDEAHFRAFDFTVNFCREHSGCDLEKAKALVRAAIAKPAAQ
jgi:excisionase family DNA binding protein